MTASAGDGSCRRNFRGVVVGLALEPLGSGRYVSVRDDTECACGCRAPTATVALRV